MADFLDLCQSVHLLLRIGEEAPGTRPLTVAGQTGVLGEIVQWVIKAHRAICNDQTNWLFMDTEGTFDLPEGGRIITAGALALAHPDFGTIEPFVNANGAFILHRDAATPDAAEIPIWYVDPQRWQGHHDVAPIPTGQPFHFTIRSDGAIEFDTIADREYTLRYRYRKAVVDLAADADTPMFPAAHHDAIVWWAILRFYCASRDGTGELRKKAEAELKREMARLYNAQLPDFEPF